MGGGGAMRAAAKVAGIGVFNGGLRAEHPVAAAARKAARPVSEVVSDDVKLVASLQDSKIDSSVQRPYWEIEDWEFAGGEDELFIGSGEPMPRLVFGGAPTIQEAKEATSELKDVLEKTYLSPNTTTELAGPLVSGQESSLLLLPNSRCLEAKPCLTSEAAVTPSAPKHAIQAFRLLNENPAAQNVVASIASDPNVWNAVLQNKDLVGFLQSHKTSVAFPDMDPSVKESVADVDFTNQQSPKCFDESCDSEKTASGNGFMDILENIKVKIRVTVVDMMNSISDTFQNLFGSSLGGAHADERANTTFVDKTIGASIMGLVVMVIMVVVLRRG